METFGAQLLNEQIERHVLVFKCFDRGIVHAVQELAKRWLAVAGCLQHQCIGKAANECLSLRHATVGDGRPDDNVVLPGISVQQRLERGKQGCEQSDSLPPAQHLEGFREAGGKIEAMGRASTGRRSAHRSVRRQIQLRDTIKFSSPISQQLLEQLAGQTFALPGRVIAIPARDCFEGRPTALGIPIIESRKIPEHHANRPPIDHKMMRHEQKRMTIRGNLEERGVQQRRAIQGKGSPCFAGDLPLQFEVSLRLRNISQINNFQRQASFAGGHNDLQKLRIAGGARGPKGFVTIDQFAETALQCRNI